MAELVAEAVSPAVVDRQDFRSVGENETLDEFRYATTPRIAIKKPKSNGGLRLDIGDLLYKRRALKRQRISPTSRATLRRAEVRSACWIRCRRFLRSS